MYGKNSLDLGPKQNSIFHEVLLGCNTLMKVSFVEFLSSIVFPFFTNTENFVCRS